MSPQHTHTQIFWFYKFDYFMHQEDVSNKALKVNTSKTYPHLH